MNTEDIPGTESKRLEFDDVFNSSFTVKRASLVWVENGKVCVCVWHNRYSFNVVLDPRDGIYTFRDPISNDILIESIEDRKSEVFVEAKDLVRIDRLHTLFINWKYLLRESRIVFLTFTPLTYHMTLNIFYWEQMLLK